MDNPAISQVHKAIGNTLFHSGPAKSVRGAILITDQPLHLSSKSGQCGLIKKTRETAHDLIRDLRPLDDVKTLVVGVVDRIGVVCAWAAPSLSRGRRADS